MVQKDQWILGITRGHNGGVCLLKNGKIVFAIEEERFTRKKYDGGPFASILKVLEYTDKLDYVAFAHTQDLTGTNGPEANTEYTMENVYLALLRKTKLIEDVKYNTRDARSHPQIFDLSSDHHKLHAWCAFVRSGFDKAATLVVDGAGTFLNIVKDSGDFVAFEVESVFDCNYNEDLCITTAFKHIATKEATTNDYLRHNTSAFPALAVEEPNTDFQCLLTDRAGTVKAYEAVTALCGWKSIEAGKTMGLSPYGEENLSIPSFYEDEDMPWPVTNRNWIIPYYPNGAQCNFRVYNIDIKNDVGEDKNPYEYQFAKDVAYKLQQETQEAVLKMIIIASEKTNNKKVVLTGGYALNCVANYSFLNTLKERGIELYVEPISNDAGTSIGAAFWTYWKINGNIEKQPREIYLGPEYDYSVKDIEGLALKYSATIDDANDEKIVDLITSRNIVTIFQGRCENGPRALGNRSIVYDPTDPNGKDFVNTVKNREFFRPFAGSILKEDVHEWFDLRGMEDTPHMMYAVECQPGIEEKIPSIIHEDGTCRIQTVTEDENPLYYRLIKQFKKQTGTPIIFNTSFNLGGEPLVETLDDAFRTLENSKLEYLYLPEFEKLITIKN